jgi:hypothetical protein
VWLRVVDGAESTDRLSEKSFMHARYSSSALGSVLTVTLSELEESMSTSMSVAPNKSNPISPSKLAKALRSSALGWY